MDGVKRRLSQTLGQMKKGFAVDTHEGGFVAVETVLAVPAKTNTAIHAAIALTTAVQTITAAITSPTVYRVLSITGNAVTAVGDVIITGKDWAGRKTTETIVSTGAATVNGTVPFMSVDSIQVPVRGAVGDTISVGTADILGLYRPVLNNVRANIFEMERRAAAGTFYAKDTMSSASAVNDVGTYTPNGGIVANDCFRVSYYTDVF